MSSPPPNAPDDTPTISRPPSYRSYLLRIWEERGEQTTTVVWRFSLEDPHTGQRRGFASLEAVTDWLTSELKESGKKINNDLAASQPGTPRPRASLKEVTRRKTKRVKRSSQ